MHDFKNRHIVVTGGTGALGTAIVGLLLRSGATCHITCLHAGELERFPYKGQVRIAEGVDLGDEASVQSFYTRFGGGPTRPRLWASIHAAGGFAMAPIEQTSLSDFEGMVRTNLTTAFLCSREAVRAMKAADGGRNAGGDAPAGGRIVNIAARPALSPEQGAGMAAYTASKAALVGLTRALAAEVVGAAILVNAVAPSIMDTPANRKSMPDADYARWPKVEEVAAAIAFLASPENRVTAGAVVPVYGAA